MFQITEVLKKVPFFQALDQEAIHYVVDKLKYKAYQKEEVICHAGDPGDKMFIIINGQVKVAVYSPDNEENVIAHLGSGDHFGEMALLTGEPRSASVITTQAAEMFILDKTNFDEVIDRYPSITLSMGKVMSRRLRRILQKTSGTKARVTAVTGSLTDRSLADILKFCEINYLNGTLKLSQNGSTGIFEYERGELRQVQLGELPEDQALDEMLGWQNGTFSIEPYALEMDGLNGSVTTFEVETETAPEPQPDAPAETPDLDNILVVNNSVVVQKMLERALTQNRWDVHIVNTSEKAHHLAQLRKPGLIISGTKLPDGSGVDLLKELRRHSNAPFLFLTEDRNKALIQSQVKNYGNVFFTDSQAIPDILRTVQEIREQFGQ